MQGQVEVLEAPARQYQRALTAFLDSDPSRANRALACVYLPADVIENMRDEVRSWCCRMRIAKACVDGQSANQNLIP